jgi:hypothetical protein
VSAYIVDKATIDALVTAYLMTEHDATGSDEPIDAYIVAGAPYANRIGSALWRENYRSVNIRYSEGKRSAPYLFDPMKIDDLKLAAPRIHGAIRGYIYQSCEHGDAFYKSKTYREIVAVLLGRIEPMCKLVRSRYGKPGEMERERDGWTIEDRHSLTSATIQRAREARS